MNLWRAKPDDLLQEVSPRRPFTIMMAIVVTLIAVAMGFLSWSALQDLLGASSPPGEVQVGPPLTLSDRAWLFAIVLGLFSFFGRAAIVLMGGVVTGRANRAALVPWWLALLFVAGLSAFAVTLVVIGLRDGDWHALRGAFKAAAFAGILAIPVARLRRAQSASVQAKDP